MKNVYTILQQI